MESGSEDPPTERTLGKGPAVAEKSDRQVFDVSGPLGGQLEELNIVPLNAIDGHWREAHKVR